MAEQDEIVFDGYAFDFKTGNYRKNDEKAKDLTRFFPILFNELKGKTVSVNRQDDGFDVLADNEVICRVDKGSLFELYLPTTQSISESIYFPTGLRNFIAPNLENVNVNFIEEQPFLYAVSAPKLKTVKNGAFYDCEKLEIINTPALEEVGNFSFNLLPSLKELNLLQIKKAGYGSFSNNKNLTVFQAPNLEDVKAADEKNRKKFASFRDNSSLNVINVPKLKPNEETQYWDAIVRDYVNSSSPQQAEQQLEVTPDNPVAHEPEKEKQTMRFGPAPNPILQMNNNTSDFSVPGSLKIRTSSTVKTPAPETSVSSSPLESTSAQKPETVSDPIKLKQEILTWNNTWGTIDWEQTTDEAIIQRIDELLEQGADINAKDKDNLTPIHIAAYSDHTKVIERLLSDKRIDVNVQNKSGATPLLDAVRYPNYTGVKALLKAKADVNLSDNDGITPLMGSVHPSGQVGILEELLNVEGVDVKAKDKRGRTLLHSANYIDSVEIIKKIISKGANVNEKDNEQNTPLHIIVGSGAVKAVQALIDNGADVNAVNKKGETPLHLAVENNRKEVVQKIIEKNVNINVQDENGCTPLIHACKKGYLDIANILMDNHSDVMLKDKDGKTALDYTNDDKLKKRFLGVPFENTWKTIDWGKLSDDDIKKQINEFLNKDADINAKDENGQTLLHLVALNGSSEIVRDLMNVKGIDVNAKDNNGWTPLHAAVFKGNIKIIYELLKAKGIDVNIQDNNGLTALHIACNADHGEIVHALIDAKADVNIRDNKGWTALELSVTYGYEKALDELLKSDKVDVNAKNKNGWTLVMKAVELGRINVVEKLVEAGADLNIKAHLFGTNALRIAAERKDVTATKRLIELGADADIPFLFRIGYDENVKDVLKNAEQIRKNYLGGTVDMEDVPDSRITFENTWQKIDWDSSSDDVKNQINMMLKRDPNVLNITNEGGLSGLTWAVQKQKTFVVDFLLRQDNIDTEVGTDKGAPSAFAIACREGQIDDAKLLIKCGAYNISLKKEWNWTEEQVKKFENIKAEAYKEVQNTSSKKELSFALCQALKRGDEASINIWLNSGADITQTLTPSGDYCASALEIAVENCDVASLRKMFMTGGHWRENIDVNKRYFNGKALLTTAFENLPKSEKIINVLLERGGDINHVNNGDLWNILIDKLQKASTPEEKKAMEDFGKRMIDAGINAGGKNIQEAFKEKIQNKDFDAIETMIRLGVQPQDAELYSIVKDAAKNDFKQQQKAIDILHTIGKRNLVVDVDSEGNKLTALDVCFESIAEGKSDKLEEMLKMKVDPNGCDKNGESLMFVAARKGNINAMEKLIDENLVDKPANIDEPRDKAGRTPLMRAINSDHKEAVRFLLNKNANTNAEDVGNFTPLHYAVVSKDIEIVKDLLKRGVSVNAVNNDGNTALHLAVLNCSDEIAKLLVNAGADINIVTEKNKKSPLNVIKNDMRRTDFAEKLQEVVIEREQNAAKRKIQMQEKQIKDKGQIYIDKGNEINKKAVKYGCVLLGYSIKCGGVVYGTTARVKNLFFGDVQKKSR